MAIAYTIAGSESSGSAGIQTDLRVFAQNQVFGVGTITCIVSFDTKGNHSFTPIAPEIILEQANSALAIHNIDTVKIGMLGTPETIRVVSDILNHHTKHGNLKKIVVDPVLICKGQEDGDALKTDNLLIEKILPYATIVTPNLYEAKILSGTKSSLSHIDDVVDAGKKILEFGPKAVLIKCGSQEITADKDTYKIFDGEAVDVLIQKLNNGKYDVTTVSYMQRLNIEKVNGAGCSLAANLTANLAKGIELKKAVAYSKEATWVAIKNRQKTNSPLSAAWTC